jgi:predicted acetyltransferase
MSTEIDYAPPADERELRAYADILMQSLHPPGESLSVADMCRAFAHGGAEVRLVRVGGMVAGGLASYPGCQWFAGRAVPSGAVADVAIAPEYRGRGAGACLMRGLVLELQRSGVALSVLYPSTQTLYRRAGYEIAGTHLEYQLETRGMAAPRSDVVVRPMTGEDAGVVEAAYRARMLDARGPFDRGRHLWSIARAAGKPNVSRYVLEVNGALEGYLVVQRRAARGDGYDIHVIDHVTLTARATACLLGFLASHRSVAREVVFSGAPAEPLVHAMAEQDGLSVRKRSDWLLRIVDAARALALRGYPRGLRAEVHLELTDALVPDNDGRWTLVVDDGAAEVRRGGRGELRADVLGLASLYTGHLSARDLRRIGKLDGDDDAVDRATAVFAGPAPWMPDKF